MTKTLDLELLFKILERKYSIEELKKLENLDLGYKQIGNIDERLFENLTQLKNLHLYNNKFKRIDSEAFKPLTNLEMLDFGSNQIKNIHLGSFEHLSNLKELHLYNNNILYIDGETLKPLIKLEKLDLAYNQKEELHTKSFLHLPNLKELCLNNNKFKRIDSEAFKPLNKLEKLDLSRNPFEEIEAGLFVHLINLKELNLFEIKLNKIDNELFKPLVKLEKLNLGSNQIREIEEKSFAHLRNLKELNLFNNILKRLDDEIFKQLTKLEKLDLSSNLIDEIDVRAFFYLSRLRILMLNKNQLKEVYRECFEPLESIVGILLFGNKIKLSYVAKDDSKLIKDYQIEFENNGYSTDWKEFLARFKYKSVPVVQPKKERLPPRTALLEQRSEETSKEDQERERIWREMSEMIKKLELEKIQILKEAQTREMETQAKEKEARENERRIKEEKIRIEKEAQEREKEARKRERQLQEELERNRNRASNSISPYERYQQIESLGFGSYSHVYKVKDTLSSLDGQDTLKAMKMMNKLDPSTRAESALLWQIRHENIVGYFDHFDHKINLKEYTFVVIEYCQNGDFSRLICQAVERKRQFKEYAIADWMCQAANGLRYLHDKCHVVHRDIKPSNLLLTKDNVVKIADLGLAKCLINTHGRSFGGTPFYMSPEQSKGREFDYQLNYSTHKANTDVWSLGCVLYELIHLKLAFTVPQQNDPPIPSLTQSGRFMHILTKMLMKNPEERIDSKRVYITLLKFLDE